MAFIEGVTIFCIAASYAVALALEIVHTLWPRTVQRLLGTAFGAAGLLAHSLVLLHYFFLAEPPLSLASPVGSLLFLSWILAVFYLYGSIHHRRLAWGVFILPLVLGLVVLAGVLGSPDGSNSRPASDTSEADWSLDWGLVHGSLLLLAGVGVCVGFVASIMYLVKAHRLQAKTAPHGGIRLLSLERLEEMNRRAILWAFPLLTAGLLVGIARLLQRGEGIAAWGNLRILGTLLLWVVFVILLYLRYGAHLRGRRVAWWTIVAFALLLFTLAAAHPFVMEGAQ
jgi:ABC-type transport system involved in cytochrome c biogenesis permease subunit